MIITYEMLLSFAVEISKCYASTIVDGKIPTPQEVAQYIKELHEELVKTYLPKK